MSIAEQLGIGECLLGGFHQKLLAQRCLGIAGFFENIADPFVGGRQSGRLGQGGKGAHCQQALADVAQTLRAQR